MMLKDSQGKNRIEFSNIIRLNKEEPIFVKMRVIISMEHITSQQDITAEFSDLKDLIKNLKNLYDSKIKKFFFQNIDETIEIIFSINDIGAITVEGKMYDENYMNSINFSFLTDLNGIVTFSKEIMNEIDNVNN